MLYLCSPELNCGVMVALGILVPSVSVRIAAVQLIQRPYWGAFLLHCIDRIFDSLGRGLPKPLPRRCAAESAALFASGTGLEPIHPPPLRGCPQGHGGRDSPAALRAPPSVGLRPPEDPKSFEKLHCSFLTMFFFGRDGEFFSFFIIFMAEKVLLVG